jgi:tRNA (adenine57-N1/adenine58-N1)-methyltransferase catalytic subunit
LNTGIGIFDMSLFSNGELALLLDTKGRRKLLKLENGGKFFSHTGAVFHDDIIGTNDASIVESEKGSKYLVLKPMLRDFVLSMPRGATVVYPKDAALIVGYSDLYPGAKVLEAGVGSGALSASILRAIGKEGQLVSYERRDDFAAIAKSNVENFFGYTPENWQVIVDDLISVSETGFTHVILDMLEPWLTLEAIGEVLNPGGILCCYVTTTTQLSAFVEKVRQIAIFTEPEAFETLLRPWHLEGLAVRPEHRMIGHTGFLIFARRMAPGVIPLVKRKRPTASSAEKQT